MSAWHKCYLCECEFWDPSLTGWWGWCPGCRDPQVKKETQKETQKGTQDEKCIKKHVKYGA